MAATATSDATDGPVMSLINKRLRALRKKFNRILQMEESISEGKTLNKEQEEVLRSKPAISAQIDELEKLRTPLSAALTEEINLAVQRHEVSLSSSDEKGKDKEKEEGSGSESGSGSGSGNETLVEDLLHLLYFGSLFDVKSQSDFTSIMLTRTHERGCCLTYDYVTDDATDLLGEKDLDLISMMGNLLISRPVNSSLSHKNALQRCIEHAKLWLARSDEPIDANADVTYATLRERLNKIMASDYFTTTPEMKAPVEVAAAAVGGNYASFQVPVHGVPADADFQQKNEETGDDIQGHEAGEDMYNPVEESKDEVENQNLGDGVSAHEEENKPEEEVDHSQKNEEFKGQQHFPRRPYQNQRGGRGGEGGQRGYSNGRGGRGGGRGGGFYQNGRNQYYDQPGNYYPRNYYNNRGRGSRGGGQSYNHHGQGSHPTNVGAAS